MIETIGKEYRVIGVDAAGQETRLGRASSYEHAKELLNGHEATYSFVVIGRQDVDCQACQRVPWQVSLVAPAGRIYVCVRCACRL